MKIDFTTIMKTLDGSPIFAESERPLTLAMASCNALLANHTGEENLSGEDKVKRYELAKKVFDDCKDISPEEATLLKKLIGKVYAPIIVGQAFEILNG